MNLKLGTLAFLQTEEKEFTQGIEEEHRVHGEGNLRADRPHQAAVTRLGVRGADSGFFGGGFFPDTANDVLDEVINALLLAGVHHTEAKFGLAFGTLADTDGKRTTKLIFNEGGFVAGFLVIPGENAKGGEIARLAFGAAGASNEILRMLTFIIGDTIQFEPSNRTNI